jgi:hypothetical protein
VLGGGGTVLSDGTIIIFGLMHFCNQHYI